MNAKNNPVPVVQTSDANFDLVRLSKSKQTVDLAPNTIRAFAEQGLRLYRHGKMVFFSRSELAALIKARAS
jgi:hypothetical protein